MRTAFSKEAAKDWHTLLSQPKVVPLKITIPVGLGYVLTSKKTGRMLGMADVQYSCRSRSSRSWRSRTWARAS